MSTPTFIVGTGRCGSTLLSNLIRQHDDIASISEFFAIGSDLGARFPALFPSEELDGPAFWDLIGKGYPRSDLMIKYGVAMPEVIYPYQAGKHRFTKESGVPLIMQATLPHITDDFDTFFDEAKAFAQALPMASIAQHYNAFFGWLQTRFNKRVWVERSGGIFNVIEQIQETFPAAKYIHIVRDGRNTALSMNSHRGFRMFVMGQFLTDSLGVDPYYSDNREKLRRVPRQYRAFLPENFDAQKFDDFRWPLSMMGRLWSGQITRGLEVLDKVEPAKLLNIRYEDLLEQPKVELTRLAQFLGDDFEDEAWLERAASVVRKPSSKWLSLDEKSRATLESTCAPGFEALAKRGISY